MASKTKVDKSWRRDTDLVELEEDIARQLDVFFAYVFERNEHATIVTDVGEDLLLGRAEAGHWFELTRPGDALGRYDARQRRFVLVVVVRRARADGLTTLQTSWSDRSSGCRLPVTATVQLYVGP